MKRRSPYVWLSGVLAAALLLAGTALADYQLQTPPDTDGVDTDGDGIVDNDYVYYHYAAGDGFVEMADGKTLYVFGFSDVTGVPMANFVEVAMLGASCPGPTLYAREGQKVFLNLSNVGMMIRPDLFDPHTVHFHGFPQAAPVFDGVPDASISINMGATLTYFYDIVEPGTFMWHCHVEATEHMQMGMLANCYILPKQDMTAPGTLLGGYEHQEGDTYCYNDGDGSTRYDVDYPIQMWSFDGAFHDASETVQPLPFAAMRDNYAMFNGRGYPDTVDPGPRANTVNGKLSQKVSSLITARQGERILLRLSSLSTTDYFTVTALGLSMQVIGQGARQRKALTGETNYYETASITLGGGEAADVIIETGDVSPGTYFLYTTNMSFLSNDQEDYGGMMTEIVIEAPAP